MRASVTGLVAFSTPEARGGFFGIVGLRAIKCHRLPVPREPCGRGPQIFNKAPLKM